MKYLINFLISFLIIISFNCKGIIDTEDKPLTIERKTDFHLVIKDQSGLMNQLYGSDMVKEAEILLKSNTLGIEYILTSDSNGVATINGIISDNYFISVVRHLTEDEMEIVTGSKVKNCKLINDKIKVIELRADMNMPVQVSLKFVKGGSPIVISEIYACGAPGAGLYWHDKSIEIFNQSDSVIYLDSMIVAVVYYSGYLGLNYVDDPEFVHSKNVWIFPGDGNSYPILPGQFVVCATDAIDHRINAPNSVDLSNADFEFYKDDAPDIDNPNVPNMIRIYQPSGNDWLIAGESGAIVIAKMDVELLQWYDDQLLIPYTNILDGVEYMIDPTRIDRKILNHSIDASATGGIQFYTGKSMERVLIKTLDKQFLKDENSSRFDFNIIKPPTLGYHHDNE